MMHYGITCLVFVIFLGCHADKEESAKQVNTTGKKIQVEYAKGFVITDHGEYREITVRHPQDTSHIIATYILADNLDNINTSGKEAVLVKTPVKSIACVSTTHAGFLEALHLEHTISGISGTRFIYDPGVRERIDEKQVIEIGTEGSYDLEKIIRMDPNIIMTYQFDDPEYDAFGKFAALGLQTVLNNEYLELTPLGQAEWIKFVAAFYNMSDYADSLFTITAATYNRYKSLAESVINRPTVFTGMPFKGEWTVPGGKSFAATYLHDAGADYIWADDEQTGNFPIAFEVVIQQALHAQFWLHAGAADNLQEITKNDSRLSVFAALQQAHVFNNNKRVNASGGNDYWESGIVNPQNVLKDLIIIFHPELFPSDTLTYYKQLH